METGHGGRPGGPRFRRRDGRPASGEVGDEFNSDTLVTNVLTQKRTSLYYTTAPTPSGSTGYTVLRVDARTGETLQMGTDQMWRNGAKFGYADALGSIQVFAPGTTFSSNGALPPLNDPSFDKALFDCRNRQPDPTGFLGPWALPLTAMSDVLESYGAGPGRVAIHGRGAESLRDPLGTARSHGCIRVENRRISWIGQHLRGGVPVRIRR